jgi:hypothetical protein
MDATNTQVMSIRLSSEELQKIDAAAAAVGLSRPDYARSKLLAPIIETPTTQLEALIKHAIYMANQIYVGLFSIAEAQGQARRFLSTQELRKVYNQVRAAALNYAVEFPEHFEAVQAEIAAKAKNGAK